jgi:Domain of unknown function (DUF4787)
VTRSSVSMSSGLGKRRMASLPEPKSQAHRQMVLLVEILLILLILFMLPKLVIAGKPSTPTKRRKSNIHMQSLLTNCQANTCSSFIPEEGLNCVLACVSPACYGIVYGLRPLEDGEVDFTRAIEFESCLKDELRTLSSRRKNQFS